MTGLDDFFTDRMFGIRDLDEYDLAAQLGVNELAPVLLIYHRNAAVGIIMEPLENGVHIEVHPFWMAERCTDPIEVTVVAPAENTG